MKPEVFVLYGPPASGKSTTLIHLALNDPGCVTVDLENYPDDGGRMDFLHEITRRQVPAMLFVGAADLDANYFPKVCRVIALLHTDEERYLARVGARDARFRRNRGQDAITHHRNIKTYLCHHPPFLLIDPARYEGQFDNMAKEILAQASKVAKMTCGGQTTPPAAL